MSKNSNSTALPELSSLPTLSLSNLHTWLPLLSLDSLRPLLLQSYAPLPRGKHRYDPVVLFRALLVMWLLGHSSLHSWSRLLRATPPLSLSLGFPSTPPSVSTFYDFLERLHNGPWQPRSSRPPSWRGTRFARALKRKPTAEHSHLANGLYKTFQANGALPQAAFSSLLQMILGEVALKPSIQRGVLPVTFDISLDSSLLASQGQTRGRPVHETSLDTPKPESKPSEPAVEPPKITVETPKPPKKQKPSRRKRTPVKERVMQVRLYSDPTASWGYCAAKEAHIYGFRCSAIVARVNRRDLPVRVSISTCSTPEIEMGMKDIAGLHHYLRDEKLPVKLKYMMADKGYDALALHKLCDDLKMLPIIPIRASTKKRFPEGFTLSEAGVPICPTGKEMRLHGLNKRQNKVTYNCPVKRPTHKDGKNVWKRHCSECPMEKLCEEKSKMGPLIHLRVGEETHLRLHPKVERESETFKEKYRDRTSTERYFSRVQGIARRPYRREHIMGMMAVSLGIKAHLQVWLSLSP